MTAANRPVFKTVLSALPSVLAADRANECVYVFEHFPKAFQAKFQGFFRFRPDASLFVMTYLQPTRDTSRVLWPNAPAPGACTLDLGPCATWQLWLFLSEFWLPFKKRRFHASRRTNNNNTNKRARDYYIHRARRVVIATRSPVVATGVEQQQPCR